ncbi:hypothetical protein ACB092_03G017400 [Castanea dentata]
MPISTRFGSSATLASFIDSETSKGEEEAWLHLLDLIDHGSLEANRALSNNLLKKCIHFGKIKEGRAVHSHILHFRFKDDLVIHNTILNMYANKDMVTWTWTALISGYSQNDRAEDALVFLLKASEAWPKDKHGRQVHAFCLKYGYDSNVYVGSSLVDMYARFNLINEARVVFDGLVSKNEVSWNALIAGHARKGEGEHALSMFREMRADFKPTHFTYSSVYSVCASTGSLEQGKWIHAHVIKSGNSMLTGYAQHGLGKESVHWFEEMLRLGIEHNHVTFLCVLSACSHAGLLDEGLYYFELMKKHMIEPQVSHYVKIVDLLGRALKFIKEMPIEPTAAVWGALLGAFRMHNDKNMELGAYAGEHVFELDPYDSGPIERVKKEPACSWVEIENAVHLFEANDDAHPQREEIHRKWEEISGKIKEIGCVPDTSHVLLFVDQHEREVKLQYHSEKLALAFALLKTPSGSPIRIKKNIRVCGDCHSAIKYVLKLVDTEIIVRDTNRFHHFRDGSCSCRDYR